MGAKPALGLQKKEKKKETIPATEPARFAFRFFAPSLALFLFSVALFFKATQAYSGSEVESWDSQILSYKDQQVFYVGTCINPHPVQTQNAFIILWKPQHREDSFGISSGKSSVKLLTCHKLCQVLNIASCFQKGLETHKIEFISYSGWTLLVSGEVSGISTSKVVIMPS